MHLPGFTSKHTATVNAPARLNRAKSAHVKMVRFSRDYEFFPSIALEDYSRDEKYACWWTREEDANRKVSIISCVRKELGKQANTPSPAAVTVLVDMQEDAQRLTANGTAIRSSPLKCFRKWMAKSGNLRGLEKIISREAGRCLVWPSYQRQDEAAEIRSLVFQIQSSLSNSHDATASVYKSQSRAGCLFAHQVALADALQASKNM
jgi:hypothetical protein